MFTAGLVRGSLLGVRSFFPVLALSLVALLCLPHYKNDDNGGDSGDNPAPGRAPAPLTPAPAPTCTPGDTEILNATLTVEHCRLGGSFEIYGLSDASGGTCSGSLGSITEADFSTLDGSSYTITTLAFVTFLVIDPEVEFGVGEEISSASKLTLDLLKSGEMTSTTFSLRGAWSGFLYFWSSPGITWADSDTVTVKIIESVACP